MSDSKLMSQTYRPFWAVAPKATLFLEALANCFPMEDYPPEVFDQQIWGDPDFDSNLCLMIEEPGAWGFAMGVLRTNLKNQVVGYLKMVAVTSACQGQGLGTTLVRELERRLFNAGAECIRVGESAPKYLFPGLNPRYTRAWVMFEKLGYRPLGHAFNLKVDLSEDIGQLKLKQKQADGEGLTFRRAGSSDRVCVMAFLGEHWPSWRPEVDLAFANQPISLHLAFQQGLLLGFSAYDCNLRGIGWFGPMGTVEAARGKGIGARLLAACLIDLRDQGLTEAIIPWVGPVGFYAKQVRARIDQVFIRLEKDRPTN